MTKEQIINMKRVMSIAYGQNPDFITDEMVAAYRNALQAEIDFRYNVEWEIKIRFAEDVAKPWNDISPEPLKGTTLRYGEIRRFCYNLMEKQEKILAIRIVNTRFPSEVYIFDHTDLPVIKKEN